MTQSAARKWLPCSPGGGFESEAVKQAGPIASLSVRALALHAGLDCGEARDADVVQPELCGSLVEAGALPEEMEIKAYRLCLEASGESGRVAQEAGAAGDSIEAMPSSAMLLADSERILAHARERIGA